MIVVTPFRLGRRLFFEVETDGTVWPPGLASSANRELIELVLELSGQAAAPGSWAASRS